MSTYVSPIPVDRLWKASICDAHNLMLKILPGSFQALTSLKEMVAWGWHHKEIQLHKWSVLDIINYRSNKLTLIFVTQYGN